MSKWIIANRFEIDSADQNLLGEGFLGKVYRGTDTHSLNPVAIKVLHPDIVSEHADFLEELLRENDRIRKLDHPNIVRLIYAGKDQGNFYLVSAFVQGTSLSSFIARQGTIPFEQALFIALGIARALAFAHENNITHNSLHPGNVLLDRNLTPKVTEFGTTPINRQPIHSPQDVSANLLPYLSPERCLGRPPTPASDIWSIGTILYEMLVGQPLFKTTSFTGILKRIIYTAPPDLRAIWPEVPENLLDIFHRTINKSPQARIPSASLLSTALEALLSGKPETTARPVGMPKLDPPFIGSTQEVERVAGLLTRQRRRLITLVGPNGIGKTRLALQVASTQEHSYYDGVHFIPLGHIRTADAIIPAFAEALYLSFYQSGRDPKTQLLNFLREKNLLLVIDQCENLLDEQYERALETVLVNILDVAPGVQVIATSEIPLDISAESTYTVRGLDFPTSEAAFSFMETDAVQMFTQSARRVQPDFSVLSSDRPAMLQLCRLTAGIPLGLELLGPLIKTQSLHEIADTLYRLRSTVAIPPSTSSIHWVALQTILKHAWDKLSSIEQANLKKLLVFQGGFTRQAAQAVTGISIEDLAGLTRKSMIYREYQTNRYYFHAIINAFLQDKLTNLERETMNNAHSVYFTTALARWEQDLKGARQTFAISEIEFEIENIHQAWKYAAEHGEIERLQQGVNGLCQFYLWSSSRHKEGEHVCQLAINAISELTNPNQIQIRLLLAWLQGWQARFSLWSNNQDRALSLLAQAKKHIADLSELDQDLKAEQAFILAQSGHIQLLTGEEQARKAHEESLALYRSLDDKWNTALQLWNLSDLSTLQGSYRQAQVYLEESLSIFQTLGPPLHTATILENLGILANLQGNFSQARRLHQEAVQIFEQANSLGDPAFMLELLGVILILSGKFAESFATLEENVEDLISQGSRTEAEHVKVLQCFPQIHMGQYNIAKSQAQASQKIFKSLDPYTRMRNSGRISFIQGCVALTAEEIPDAQKFLKNSVDSYQHIDRQDELARSLAVLAMVLLRTGSSSHAQQNLIRALALAADTGFFEAKLYALAAAALLLIQQDDKNRALELYAMLLQQPLVANSQWFKLVVGNQVDALLATLPQKERDSLWERGQNLKMDPTIASLQQLFKPGK